MKAYLNFMSLMQKDFRFSKVTFFIHSHWHSHTHTLYICLCLQSLSFHCCHVTLEDTLQNCKTSAIENYVFSPFFCTSVWFIFSTSLQINAAHANKLKSLSSLLYFSFFFSFFVSFSYFTFRYDIKNIEK